MIIVMATGGITVSGNEVSGSLTVKVMVSDFAISPKVLLP